MSDNNQTPKATPPSPNAIVMDSYDRVMFKHIQSASKDVRTMTGSRDEDANLASDVFSSFYKMSPEINANAAQPQRTMMEALHKLPEFQAARSFTTFDDVGSTLATLKFAPTMLEQFRKVRTELEKQQQKKAQGQPGEGQPDEGDGDEQGEGEGGDGIGPNDQLLQQFRVAAREALDEAADEANKWRTMVNSFGIEPGELEKMPVDKKLKLAEQLLKNPAIHRIATLVGRFKSLALGAKATTPSHGFDEVVDIGQGAELARLLPSEALKLSKMKTLFYKDFTERSLAIYNMRGIDYMGMGPLVVCGDVSGSMSGPREEWCKAVILAFMQIGEKLNRAVAVITFEEPVVDTWKFPKGQRATLEQKLEILSFNSNGGGTNFTNALDEALDFIAKEGGTEFRPADIAFVTDGAYSFNGHDLKKILSRKESSGVRVFGINVAGQNANIDQSLSKFCDAVFTVDDTGDVTQARGALLGVTKRQERKPAKKATG